MKNYEHLSFRLQRGDTRDNAIKIKLQELKKERKESFNSILKYAVEKLECPNQK